MKILFVGSIPTFDHGEDRAITDDETSFARVCENLGFEAVARGHEVYLCDDHPQHVAMADTYVLDGVNRFASEEENGPARVELNLSEGSNAAFENLYPNIAFNVYYHKETESDVGPRSLIPILVALEACNLLIVVGGKRTARLIGNIALTQRKPTVAMPAFGGSANEIYNQLSYFYSERFLTRKHFFTALRNPASPELCRQVIEMGEALASPDSIREHAYFLSYKSEESPIADHVELLLLRNRRRVIRDEDMFNVGDDLSDIVKSMIAECDTFISLWSSAAAKSEWCPNELSYARKLLRQGRKPTRVLLILLDDEEVRIEDTNILRLDGADRRARELSIRKIIDQEDAIWGEQARNDE